MNKLHLSVFNYLSPALDWECLQLFVYLLPHLLETACYWFIVFLFRSIKLFHFSYKATVTFSFFTFVLCTILMLYLTVLNFSCFQVYLSSISTRILLFLGNYFRERYLVNYSFSFQSSSSAILLFFLTVSTGFLFSFLSQLYLLWDLSKRAALNFYFDP